ncbi:MAG: hypothetical protein AAF585_01365 [Verrucomicrobiota bacterium]
MIKFIMALAMAALVGAAVFAAINMMRLGEEKDKFDLLVREYNDLNSSIKETSVALKGPNEDGNGGAQLEERTAKDENDQVRAMLAVAMDDLRKKQTDMERLMAEYDGKKAELEELALIKEKLKGRTPESVKAEYDGLVQTLSTRRGELDMLKTDIVKTSGEVEKNNERIADLQEEEEERRERVALNGMEAMVIAVNRDYGFVIINAGSEIGVTPDASLLVQRGVDRIGRLRIVQVDPKLTIADIIPGSVSPGAQIMVRDQVIFENVFR